MRKMTDTHTDTHTDTLTDTDTDTDTHTHTHTHTQTLEKRLLGGGILQTSPSRVDIYKTGCKMRSQLLG